mgnify:CR=1 FL=1
MKNNLATDIKGFLSRSDHKISGSVGSQGINYWNANFSSYQLTTDYVKHSDVKDISNTILIQN